MAKDSGPRLRIGVLGCGPIAQAAHLESCRKASNAQLYAVCDVAEDLVAKMAAIHEPARAFTDYDAMLSDPNVQAVIIATSDSFHVSATAKALEAGKHVLCEKPLATSVEEAEGLRTAVRRSGRVLQVGHMKRFDQGLQSAKGFIDGDMGELLALKAWYCDSIYRYTVTDAMQPMIVRSQASRKPSADPKADLRRYFMLAHGSHLLDTARFLGGEIVEVQARWSERFGSHCWFVDVAFANGALGHLDLTIPVRMDWHEGFQIYGEHGSIVGKTFDPWCFRTSEVEIFREATGDTTRTLGADGHFYRRQVESFADTILNGSPMAGAGLEDGIAAVRGMVAISESVRRGTPVKLADASGAV